MTLAEAVLPEQIEEIIDLVAETRCMIYDGGAWRKASYTKDAAELEYGNDFGRRSGVPIDILELHGLPERLGLEQLGCYAAETTRFIDWFLMPLVLLACRIKRGLGRATFARWLLAAYKRSQGPERGCSLVLDAEGTQDGEDRRYRVVVGHDDVYFLTAAPAAACVLQYLRGQLEATGGVHLMAHVVAPDVLLDDLAAMGVSVERP